jgi:replicative DNA helicase
MTTPQERKPDPRSPGDKAAERAVAAALLVDAAAFDEMRDLLTPEDFADPLSREVVAAAIACEAAGTAIDEITVANEMRRRKVLAKVGGTEALNGLIEEATHITDHVNAHALIVAEKSRLRATIHAAREMAGAAMAPDAVWADVKELTEQAIGNLSREHGQTSLLPLSRTIPPVLKQIADGRSQMLLGHSTGYPELDRLTAGLQPGQLVVVAARPGMGKSAFALQLAQHVAETSGLCVPFFSYEMSNDELTTRMLASTVGYDLLKLRMGDLPPGLDRTLAEAGAKLTEIPVMLDDNPPVSITGLRSAIRRLARRTQLGMVVVDYIQLMEGERRSRDFNRTTEVSEISRGLKRLASELGVPIVALSQLNRSLETRTSKRPMLSDLRESGSIEQDASIVMFLYRDSRYNSLADPTEAEVIIAKQRNGPSGLAIPVIFEGELGARFRASALPARAAVTYIESGRNAGNGNPF